MAAGARSIPLYNAAPMKDYLHILVVDDDEVDRIAVNHALRQSGIKAHIDEAKQVPGSLWIGAR